MNTHHVRALVLAVLVAFSTAGNAEDMIMGRIPMRAEVVMEYLKSSIQEHGYKVAHVQMCDGGMQAFGYQSDVYRVVFFGKIAEVRMLSEKYPELVSYLPLKMAVIAEKDETLISVLNPEALAPFFKEEELQTQFGRWRNDLVSILKDVRRTTEQNLVAAN